MDNSIIYGFRNPAMTEDIGMSMIERQFPTNITPLGYTPNNVTNKSAYYNQPYADTFQTKQQKEHSAFKKILVGLGLVALGFFAYKKGTKGIKEFYDTHIKTLFKKGTKSEPLKTATSGIFDKCKKGYECVKNYVIDLYNKTKNGISNLFNKIKPKKVSP